MPERDEQRAGRAQAGAPQSGRWVLLCAIGAAVVLVLGLAIYLYDHSRRDTIAAGVRIDGVAVGGLSASAALRKVQREVATPLAQPVVVRSSAGTWTLTPGAARLRVDAQNMVDQALAASRQGSIFTRTFRSLTGATVNTDVPLAVSYSHAAVRGLTAQVRAALDSEPQNATVAAGADGLTKVPGRAGVKVDSAKLGGRIEYALTGALGTRTISVPVKTVQPKVTTAQLASEYPAYIVVDRGAFELHLYEHLKLARTYPIAVGMQGLETPPGLYHIQWKEVNPPWIVPDKAWAGALAGKTVPPGPEDPLKARFMSFDGGAGIHGIAPSEYSSIGHDASHGCVRMTIPDVIALYSRTPVGTPVYII